MRWCHAVIAVPLTASATAQSLVFVRVADTNTVMPVTGQLFQQFLQPAVDDGVVAFTGGRPLPAVEGVYRWSGGPVVPVADRATLSPGGHFFLGFGMVANWLPSLDGNDTAFQAGDGFEGGVYLRSTTGIVRVATTLVMVPNGNGGTFQVTDSPVVQGARVVFAGAEAGDNQKGIYSWQGGVLSIVADRSTPIPGGAGTFTSFGRCALDAGRVAFHGLGAGQQRGIYVTTAAGAIERRYDRNTVVPGGNGAGFSNLGIGAFDHGAVAFQAQGGGTEGVYSDLGGTLFAVADKSTPVPGRPGLFQFFGDVSLDGDTLRSPAGSTAPTAASSSGEPACARK